MVRGDEEKGASSMHRISMAVWSAPEQLADGEPVGQDQRRGDLRRPCWDVVTDPLIRVRKCTLNNSSKSLITDSGFHGEL